MDKQEDPRIEQIRAVATPYHNFPKENVSFIDVFPIVANPTLLNHVTDIFTQRLAKVNYSKIFMLQSRGFLFGIALSLKTGVPVYPVRKKGKLPGECVGGDYGLQYGKDSIEIQKHSIKQGDEVVIIDDLLATGGTMKAVIDLLKGQGAKIAKILLLIELDGMNGRQKLGEEAEKVDVLWKTPAK